MFKAIGWLIKIALFSIAILVLGNWVEWGGETVSDQVKARISQAERSEIAGSLRRWTSGVTEDARKGAKKALSPKSARVEPENKIDRSDDVSPERIPSSERQKLRALIQELNSSKSAARRAD